MSSNLRAEPAIRKKLDLGTSLKFALRKMYGEPVDVSLNEESIPVLKAMIAAGDNSLANDAYMLISFIETHELVLVKEEY